jgi:colanic acid biosynthesis glycosyl transferase WcaI
VAESSTWLSRVRKSNSDKSHRRIMLNDWTGHPFQYELSQELGRRGHSIVHAYCSSVETPQASFDLSAGVVVEPLSVGRQFNKFRLKARLVDEMRYGRKSVSVIRRFRPDLVVTSNMPLLSLFVIYIANVPRRATWVLSLQDLQAGLAGIVRGTRSPVARSLGALERFLIRRADVVVAISPELEAEVARIGRRKPTVMIPNWAPMGDMPMRPRRNQWSHQHGLDDRTTFLYSGTLGIKHAPHLLLQIADELIALRPDSPGYVVVVAQGSGADWLRDELQKVPRPNVLTLPFQPFDVLPDVLASGDVLVSLLDASAGAFSVPSKTLSYLCAGRAILGAIPAENAAARMIAQDAQAGLVSPPEDIAAVRDAVRALFENDVARDSMGVNARNFAERHFDIRTVADRFLAI